MAELTMTIPEQRIVHLVRHAVSEVLQDFFTDPDYGLSLNQNFVKRLQKSVQSKKSGRVVPFSEIAQKYSK